MHFQRGEIDNSIVEAGLGDKVVNFPDAPAVAVTDLQNPNFWSDQNLGARTENSPTHIRENVPTFDKPIGTHHTGFLAIGETANSERILQVALVAACVTEWTELLLSTKSSLGTIVCHGATKNFRNW